MSTLIRVISYMLHNIETNNRRLLAESWVYLVGRVPSWPAHVDDEDEDEDDEHEEERGNQDMDGVSG